ncbi:MAG: alcohol dehydrogenase, propanol-preferring [Solirubrobacteraceae bacterium]|jgi:propanol-preferring alcohol dehydrogenase|nr:alcohol dehydrogenase, propanol-preferring [Solirubrobacteraceae bacterium]
MVLDAPGRPLRWVADLSEPEPGPGQAVVAVHACGVCRTDLHIADGELRAPRLPLVPGHQVVGTVLAAGEDAELTAGTRVGIPWLAWTCGTCRFCASGRENLCERARFTGLDVDGGYATHAVADARFCLALPEGYGDLEAAPLLCAGLIGHRALRMAGDAERLGLYGFGASAHIVCQVARHQGRRVFAFTRREDDASQRFALELGCEWAGDAMGPPPEELDAAIVFAPAGALVPAALRALAPGGTVVCAGIHMSDIPSFPYADLWRERSIRSVANLTRADATELLALAPRVPVRTRVTAYGLRAANDALADLRAGRLEGAAVLVPDGAGASDGLP